MDYLCPHCNSQDVKKLSLIYEQGTTSISLATQSTSLGAGVLSGELGVGIGASSGAVSGVQQSALSQRIAPPRRKFPKLPIHPNKRGDALVIFGVAFALLGAPVVWWYGWASYWTAVGAALGAAILGWLLRFTMSSDELAAHAEECKRIDIERARILEEHSMSDDPFETWNRSFMCLRCGTQFDPLRQQAIR